MAAHVGMRRKEETKVELYKKARKRMAKETGKFEASVDGQRQSRACLGRKENAGKRPPWWSEFGLLFVWIGLETEWNGMETSVVLNI